MKKVNERAYIYVFVSKDEELSIRKRLFFVGSCLVADLKENIKLHIKDLFFPVGDELEKDIYIKNEVGLHNFEIYIYDTVARGLMLTYHKIYYDILCSENYELKHRLEIKPEYTEVIKNRDFVRCAYKNYDEFRERELNQKGMTYIEVLINELKGQYILNSDMYIQLNMDSNKYMKQIRLTNKKLKRENTQLAKLYEDVMQQNKELTCFNLFLKNPSGYEHK
tara:strand:+ start:3414 stop:4079 length:666 start_codon:yes stop_codon:yes gene_type:complete